MHHISKISWPLIWRSLNGKEKFALYFFVSLILASLFALTIQLYYARTQIVPARGETYTEAAFDIPRFINPALAQITDTDRDITRLVYAGLMKYTKDGRISEDLAERYTIENDTLYTFTLRKNLLWHDGQLLTADDIVFTIKLIQDPKYASPLLFNWQGVEVEKVDESTVTFKLVSPYSPFLENATVGILPKHIWENASPKSFPHAEANLQPTGSGPYMFEKFQKDSTGAIKTYSLRLNERYHGTIPSIERITFRFFDSEDEALLALTNHEVSGISLISGYNASRADSGESVTLHTFTMPRYFAVFFNQSQSKALAEHNVRKALAHALDRSTIIQLASAGYGIPAYGPIVPELLGYNPQIEEKYPFSPETAKEILETDKWLDTDGDGVREKIFDGDQAPTPLEIRLITVQWPELEKTLRALKEQWERVGARVITDVYTLGEIQQEFIRPRDYQAIIFGQVIGIDPDPFSFWHSSQKKDPGLNLSLYDNKDADKLLEVARQTLDSQARSEKYVAFQNLVVEDLPAIFLYSPSYLYPVSSEVKNIQGGKIADPSWRFADVEEWYIKTKRVWK